ncbi:hypothetical protein N8I77_003283 [Diaporthe amygdali]|uniref:NACHT domain-containing protein n=1 Tax=Phomopsis amygdali TaxID=1214568 RepID=A0AAD9W6L0_PHOAM|nr:hypothetical protein N8I77_003283 [Diaporthe amygdali]
MNRRTWRIRGVPREFDKDRLARVLRYHSSLQWSGDDIADIVDNDGNDVNVYTLAPDLRGNEQDATVRFDNLPSQLSALGNRGQLRIKINIETYNRSVGQQHGRVSIRTVEVSIDEHFDGITTLISPGTDENHHIDVLAISGLGSHPFGSFVNKEDGNMWLTNDLPRDLPTARVMIFGYESRLQHSNSFVQLDDLASPLRDAVSRLLRLKKRKPLLLIGHSLGGLLAKQALVRIAESQSDFASELPSLRDMILGMLLFGTPNDGLDVESLVPMVNDQPNRSLLESLRPNSAVLKQQRQAFSIVLERIKFQLICFYETELSPTAAKDPITGQYKMSGPRRCLVSEPSATSCLPGDILSTNSISIRRTHSDLVKFSSHDAEYERVAYVLERIQKREYQCIQVKNPAKKIAEETFPSSTEKRPRTANEPSDNEHPQTDGNHAPRDPFSHLKQSLKQHLYFSKIDERLTHLTSAHVTTCRWFLTGPKYKSWQNVAQLPNHGGFLWIKGHPGTGKSTLMKYLFEEAKINAKDDDSQLTLSFFFLARGTTEEKRTTGLYRSLLHQLFELASDLQDSLRWMTVNGAKTIQEHGWTEEALQQTLKHAIPKLEHRSLTIFVDALDECDENKAGDMVFFFEELCVCAAEAGVQVQICFSSRYYPTVVVNKGIEVSLEAEIGHTEDIQKYVKSRLKLNSKSNHAEALRSEIFEKSSGIFLWVVLVIDMLNKDQSISIQKKRERLKEMPPKLNDLFQMILTRDGDNLEQLQLCLKWILFASRPLQPQELYFAIQFGSDKDCSGSWDQADLDLDDMKAFVRSSSKGLAEVTRNTASNVQFIHESVRDFLLGNYEGQWLGDSGNLRGHAHETLRDCCFAQMDALISQSADIPESVPRAFMQGQQLREDIRLKFPFLEYSVQNLLYHSNFAQQNGLEQGRFLADFPLQRWILLNNALEHHGFRRHTKSVSLLYILAENNLADLIQIHPRRKFCFHVEAERYGAPIFAAVFNNSHLAVRMLLRAQAENQPPMSPLHGLCGQYELDQIGPFRIPFSHTLFNLDYTFSRPRILYDLLKCGEAVVALAFLLSSHDLTESLNWGDVLARTPLMLAVENRREAVIRLLLQRGAHVDSKDCGGKTPLIIAALNGYETIVKLLLERGAGVDSRDIFGQTSLSHAAEKGHEVVVKLLLENGADVESRNKEGLTPLSFAVEMEKKAVVSLLLDKGAHRAMYMQLSGYPKHSAAPSRFQPGRTKVWNRRILTGEDPEQKLWGSQSVPKRLFRNST